MWFGTDQGAYKYDPSAALRAGGKTFRNYDQKDGLNHVDITRKGILVDKSGIIWVTARGYATRFDPSIPLPNPQAFTVYTPANGLNCCVQSMYQDKAGNMWWGAG